MSDRGHATRVRVHSYWDLHTRSVTRVIGGNRNRTRDFVNYLCDEQRVGWVHRSTGSERNVLLCARSPVRLPGRSHYGRGIRILRTGVSGLGSG